MGNSGSTESTRPSQEELSDLRSPTRDGAYAVVEADVEQLRMRSVILEEMCGLLQEGRSWDEPVEVRLPLPMGLSVSRSGIVGAVHEGGNAERTGKIAAGDLVVSVDGVELCQGAVWLGDALDPSRELHTVRLERLGDIGQLRHRSAILEEMCALLQEGREWGEPFTVRLRHPLGIGISRAGIVGEVYPEGNADRSGRIYPGDLVLSVDGNSLRQGKLWLGDALDTSHAEHDVVLQRLRSVAEVSDLSEGSAGMPPAVLSQHTAQSAQVLALTAEVAMLREQIQVWSTASPGWDEPPAEAEACQQQVEQAAAEVEAALAAGPIDFGIGSWDVTDRPHNESILAAVAAALRRAPAAYLHIHGVQNGVCTPDDHWRRRFEADFPGELIDERASTAQGRALACRRRLLLLGVEGRRVRVTTRVSNQKQIKLLVESREEAKERQWTVGPPAPWGQSLDLLGEPPSPGRGASGEASGNEGRPHVFVPPAPARVEEEVERAAAALAGRAVEFEPESWLFADERASNALLADVARVLAQHPSACVQLHGVQKGVVPLNDPLRQRFASDFGEGIAMDPRAGLAQARALACEHRLLELGLAPNRIRVSVEISNQERVEFEVETEAEASALRTPPPQPAPISQQLEAASSAVAAALRARPVAFQPRSWDVDDRTDNAKAMAEVAIALKRNPAVHLHVHCVQARGGAALDTEQRAALTASFPGVHKDERAPLARGRALACVARLAALGVDERRVRITTNLGERERLEMVAVLPPEQSMTPRALCSTRIASTRGSPMVSARAAETGVACRAAPRAALGTPQGVAACAAGEATRHEQGETKRVDATNMSSRRMATDSLLRAAQLREEEEAPHDARRAKEEAMLTAASKQSARRRQEEEMVVSATQQSARRREEEEMVDEAARQSARRRQEEEMVSSATQQSARRREEEEMVDEAARQSARRRQEEEMVSSATQQSARRREEEEMVDEAARQSARRRQEEEMVSSATQQSARRREEEEIVYEAARQSARRRGKDAVLVAASQREAQLREEEQVQAAARRREEKEIVAAASQQSARRREEEEMVSSASQQSARRREEEEMVSSASQQSARRREEEEMVSSASQQSARRREEEEMVSSASQQSARRREEEEMVSSASQQSARRREEEEMVSSASQQSARRREEEEMVSSASQQSARRREEEEMVSSASQQSARRREEEEMVSSASQQSARRREEEEMVSSASQQSARRREEEEMVAAASQQSARRREEEEIVYEAARQSARRRGKDAVLVAASQREAQLREEEQVQAAARRREEEEMVAAASQQSARRRQEENMVYEAARQSARRTEGQARIFAATHTSARRIEEKGVRRSEDDAMTVAATQTSAMRMEEQVMTVATTQLSARCNGQNAALNAAAAADTEPMTTFLNPSRAFHSTSLPGRAEHKSSAAAPNFTAASADSPPVQGVEMSESFSFAVGGATRQHLAQAEPRSVSATAPVPAPASRQVADGAMSRGSTAVKTRSARPSAHSVSKPRRISEVERQSEVGKCTEALQHYLGIQPPVQRDMRRMLVFKGNSSDVTDGTDNSTILSEVARILAAHPNTRMMVRGETDNRARVDLARVRAKACLDSLVAAGIAPSRLQSVGRIGKLRRVEFLPL